MAMIVFTLILALVTEIDHQPTYYDDVGPLLRDHCVECHSPGQIAPMSFRTYDEVRPWAKSILKEVTSKRMPPFSAVGPLGRYKDDPRLSDNEIGIITRWVNGRMLRGDVPDEGWHVPEVQKADEWSQGEPDLIISLPEYVVKDGNEAWPWIFVEPVFEEDTYIRSSEWRLDNRKLPHHIGMFTISKDFPVPEGGVVDFLDPGKDLTGANLKFTSTVFLYTPGTKPNLLPTGWATVLPKNRRLLITAHYSPGEIGDTARPQLGLYYAQGFIRPMEIPHGPGFWTFTIPPGDPAYTLTGRLPFKFDGLIEGFFVHMHVRGKSGRFYLAYPDSRRELVLDVPKFDFHWQRAYWLTEPIPVKKGTILEFEATWDNSADNPDNPDPTAEVISGQGTNDEMMGGAAFWRRTDFVEPPIPVLNGRRVDRDELLANQRVD